MKRDEMERLEAAVRDANPVPYAPDLVNTEEADAVTLLVEEGRRTMPTSPAQTMSRSMGPPPRPSRRSIGWAFAAGFVLVVLVVGAAALVLRGNDVPVADEPAPPVVTTAEDKSTPSTPALPDAESRAYRGWEWITIDPPWLGSVVDVAPLPGGGFAVAATAEWTWTSVESPDGTEWQRVAGAAGEWSVLWSPDGIEWRDADPRRQVNVAPLSPGWFGSRPRVIAPIGGGLAVLDGAVFGIRIGDVETQSWEAIEFDTSDLVGEIGLLAVASNEADLLVVGYEDDYGGAEPAECGEAQSVLATRHFAWLVDARSGEVQRSTIPAVHDGATEALAGPRGMAGARVCGDSYTSVVWFKGSWILDLDGSWLTSTDGTTWTPVSLEHGPSAATLMAGPDTLLATTWNSLWYSENGTDWTEVSAPLEARRGPSDATAYSESFGYVATPWSDPGFYVSSDGRDWQYAGYWPDVDQLTASGDRALGIGEFGRAYLFISSGRLEVPDSSVSVGLPDRGDVVLDQTDDFIANLAVGDVFTVGLPGYSPAGSGWKVVEPPGICRLLEGPVFEHEEGEAEWEGTYRFTFEALEVGSGELVFEYHSPRDTGADLYTLVVDVDA